MSSTPKPRILGVFASGASRDPPNVCSWARFSLSEPGLGTAEFALNRTCGRSVSTTAGRRGRQKGGLEGHVAGIRCPIAANQRWSLDPRKTARRVDTSPHRQFQGRMYTRVSGDRGRFSLSRRGWSCSCLRPGICGRVSTAAGRRGRQSAGAREPRRRSVVPDRRQVLELKKRRRRAMCSSRSTSRTGVAGSLLDRPGLEALRKDLRDSSLRCGVLPRHRSHRPRCRVSNNYPRRAPEVRQADHHQGQGLRQQPRKQVHGHRARGRREELERAKIIERTTRGRLHRLRMGELSSNGHRIYGYHYLKKSPAAPAALVINEEQAPVVRSIFEMFCATGRLRPGHHLALPRTAPPADPHGSAAVGPGSDQGHAQERDVCGHAVLRQNPAHTRHPAARPAQFVTRRDRPQLGRRLRGQARGRVRVVCSAQV